MDVILDTAKAITPTFIAGHIASDKMELIGMLETLAAKCVNMMRDVMSVSVTVRIKIVGSLNKTKDI